MNQQEQKRSGALSLKRLVNTLTTILAILSALVAVGLIAKYSMWPFIVAYWCVLTLKNIIDDIRKGDSQL